MLLLLVVVVVVGVVVVIVVVAVPSSSSVVVVVVVGVGVGVGVGVVVVISPRRRLNRHCSDGNSSSNDTTLSLMVVLTNDIVTYSTLSPLSLPLSSPVHNLR